MLKEYLKFSDLTFEHVFSRSVCFIKMCINWVETIFRIFEAIKNQRTNGPVNAHLISWPSKAQNIQSQENIW